MNAPIPMPGIHADAPCGGRGVAVGVTVEVLVGGRAVVVGVLDAVEVGICELVNVAVEVGVKVGGMRV
jgi:hypothetical protein